MQGGEPEVGGQPFLIAHIGSNESNALDALCKLSQLGFGTSCTRC